MCARYTAAGGASNLRLTTMWVSPSVVIANSVIIPVLSCCLLRQETVEAPVILRERSAQQLQILLELRECPRCEPTRSLRPLHALHDEPRLGEHADVPRDRRLRDRERFGQLIHGGLPQRQPRKNRAPSGICQSCQGAIERLSLHDR